MKVTVFETGEKGPTADEISGKHLRKKVNERLSYSAKNGTFRRFSEAKSHDVGESRQKYFPQSLIPNELEIICKVLGEIYTPGGYRGGRGVLFGGDTDRAHY
jgi:hypothetical protein